jgi:hypothetical protein
MSRPKPKVVLENIDKKTFKSDQILDAEAIWAVFYQGKPFNLKSQNSFSGYSGSKYKKVSFSNQGHAINLCKKLNSMFKTDDFSVVKMTQGEQVYPK